MDQYLGKIFLWKKRRWKKRTRRARDGGIAERFAASSDVVFARCRRGTRDGVRFRWDDVVVRRVPRVLVVVVVVVDVRAADDTRESCGMPRGSIRSVRSAYVCVNRAMVVFDGRFRGVLQRFYCSRRALLRRKNAEFLRAASGSPAMGNHEASDERVGVNGASVDSRVSKARMASQVARARRRRTESSGFESSAA